MSLDSPQFYVYPDGRRDKTCKPCRRAYARDWYAAGGETTKRRKRDFMAKKRAANPEAERAKQRKWWDENRERGRAKNRAYAKRRFFWIKACKVKGVSAKELASLWKKQRGLCALTGRRLDRSAQLDHILPRARGGTDAIANLQWVCREINLAKRDLTEPELLSLCQDTIRWILERVELADAAMLPERAAA